MEEETKPQKPAPKAAEKVAPSLETPQIPPVQTVPAAPFIPTASVVPTVQPDEFTIPDEAYADMIVSDPTAHAKSTTAHHSSAWGRGPGAFQLLVEATNDLLDVSALRGKRLSKIEYVRLHILTSIKTVLVVPSTKKDPAALEVAWRKGQAFFNASDDLIRAGIAIESGRKERYRVHVLKESKVGPALAIDMKAIVDVKNFSTKKKGKGKNETSDDEDDIDLDEE